MYKKKNNGSGGGGQSMADKAIEKFNSANGQYNLAVTYIQAGKLAEAKAALAKCAKDADSKVVLLKPEYDENKLPKTDSLLALFDEVVSLMRDGKVLSAYTPTYGGVAEAVMKMAFGNGLGFAFDGAQTVDSIFGYNYASFLLEATEDIDGEFIGTVTENAVFTLGDESLDVTDILKIYEDKLESVYSCNIADTGTKVENFSFSATERKAPAIKVAKPKILIPAFPGTNCEFDSAKAVRDAGAEPEIIVIKNRTSAGITESVNEFASKLKNAQMIFIPGGFSGGDEPDGSAKFITAFFRNPAVKEAVTDLLDNRDGLMCGICNGFQALIKLGLVPHGQIVGQDENSPTLTFNTINRHISKMVYTKVVTNKSPWLQGAELGKVYCNPASHGEGRFVAPKEWLDKLFENGQVATQYVNEAGVPTMDEEWNVNGSYMAIEGITSPDGRVLGKMAHSERRGDSVAINIYGEQDLKIFESGVKYFK